MRLRILALIVFVLIPIKLFGQITSPQDISGLIAWYSTDSVRVGIDTHCIDNNIFVKNLRDVSTNSNDLDEVTSLNGMLYCGNLLYDGPLGGVIRDPTASALGFITELSSTIVISGRTLVMRDQSGAAIMLRSTNNQSSTPDEFNVHFRHNVSNNADSISISFINNATFIGEFATAVIFDSTNYVIFITTLVSGGNITIKIILSVNGGPVSTLETLTTSYSPVTNDADEFSINTGTANPFKFIWYEVAVYNIVLSGSSINDLNSLFVGRSSFGSEAPCLACNAFHVRRRGLRRTTN